jgi:tetratricopeptide (TPR) repeat protein
MVPLHGRSSDLALIAGAIDAVERGERGGIIVSGSTGMGKSALLAAAIHRARGRGFRVVSGRATPRDTAIPFDLMRGLLRPEVADGGDPVVLERLSGLPQPIGGGDDSGLVSDFPTVAVLPEEDAPVEKLILRLFDLEHSLIALSRRALFGQLEWALLGEPKARPALVVVDDLHHADRDSLEFLLTLLTSATAGRLLFLASVDAESSVAGPRGTLLEAFSQAPNTAAVLLSGLSLDDTAAFIRELRPDETPLPEYLLAIYRRSKGVPAAIESLTRRYREAPPSSGHDVQTDGSPTIGFNPASFPEETQRILTYGAVIGRRFELAVLARALRRRAPDTLKIPLAPLLESGALRRRGGTGYEFASPSLRQELYSRLPEARRRLLHRNVARALELGARPAGPELFEIAYHYHLAGETVSSVDYNRRAAEVASSVYAYDEARVYLERALDSLGQLPSSKPESVRAVRVALGHVLSRLGKVAEARLVLDPLRDPTESGPVPPSPLEQLFVPDIRPDLWAHAVSARASAERSLRAFRTRGELRWLAVAHRALGVAAWSLSDPTAAESHHRAAAGLARVAGDARLEGQSLLDRAHLVRLLDPNGLALSRRLLTEAIERFTASGDAEWLTRSYIDRSSVLRGIGRLPDALSDLTSAAEQARRTGSQALEIWVQLRMARVLVDEGRTGRARKTLDRLGAIVGANPRREVEQQIAFISGLLQQREGRLDKARVLYEKSLALAIEAGTPEEAADSHKQLAELDTQVGRPEEARRHLDEAERLGAPGALLGPGPSSV